MFFSEQIMINRLELFLLGIYFSCKGYSLLKPAGRNFTFSFTLCTINTASDIYADMRRNRVRITRKS